MSNEKTILIVEDDGDIRETISCIFSALGWTVFQAEEGNQALSVYAHNKPKVLLTDIDMPLKSDGTPGMDGIELINRLTDMYGDDKPLMFVNSGYPTNEALITKMEAVLAYFSKPTPATQIIASLERHMLEKSHP